VLFRSGNVRDKLCMSQLAAESRPEFKVNVDALTKAQPKDLEASEIDVRLGATWLDPSIVQQFMMETFQPPYRIRYNNAITVRYSPYTSEWRISNKSATGFGDIMATETYGTRRANAYKILEDTLNLRDSRVYDTIVEDGKEKRVLNQNETTLAQQKQQAMPNADMMLLGTYRGFELNIRFDSFKNERQAVLRAELSYPVSLGDDARGNITRLDNAIDNFADRIR